MSANETSLLLRLRGESSGAVAAAAQTRAAVSQLRSSVAADLGNIQAAGKSAFEDIANNLNVFVGQRIPLVGGAFLRVTQNLKGLGEEAAKPEGNLLKLGAAIEGIASKTGKTQNEVGSFLQTFSKIETQAARDTAALNFFGASATKIAPELQVARTELTNFAAAGESATASAAGFAAGLSPVVIAIVAAIAAEVALVAIQVVLIEKMFAATKAAAEFEGKLYDLSQQTGVSVETLSALEVMSATTGGTIEGIAASLGIFQKKLEEVQDPASKTAATFRQLGVDTTNTETALESSLLALSKMPEGFHQTALALELFGRGGKGILAILKEMNGDLEATKQKLREMGILISTEDAKAADEFNDQLKVLDFQLRSLTATITRESLPAILEVAKQVSETLRENRLAIKLAGDAVYGFFVIPVKSASVALTVFNEAAKLAKSVMDQLNPVIQKSAEFYERIKAATLGASAVPGPTVGAGASVSGAGATPFDVGTIRSTIAGAIDPALEAQKRAAEASIAENKILFEEGKKTQRELTEVVITATKSKVAAEIAGLEELRRIKKAESELSVQNVAEAAAAANELLKIDETIKDKKLELLNVEATERAKLRKQEEADELAHRTAILERSEKLDEISKAQIANQVAAGKKTVIDGDDQIAAIENNAVERRSKHLHDLRDLAGQNVSEVKKINDQINALETERSDNAQKQAERRIAIVQREFDITGALFQAKYARQLASVSALEQSRVITSEQAATRTLAIKLAAKDKEIEIATALGRDLRLLQEERKAIEEQGARDIEAGRQTDLDNARAYADDLLSVQREIAEEEIALMIIHHARRSDIIRADARLAANDENTRHKRELDRLKALKASDALIEAEKERHRLRMKRIADQQKRDEALAGPGGGFFGGLNSGQLAELENGVQSFSDIATVGLSAVGAAVNGLAQGVGSLLQNWILLGSEADINIQKVVASVLAGVAAQAAVLAVMELAYGIAALTPWGAAIYGPAPLHFKAAALFGSIAVATALAGRAVAGDAFKQKPATGGGGGGGGSGSGSRSSNGTSNGPTTINAERNVIRLDLHLHNEPGAGFNAAVVKSVVKNISTNGAMRKLIVKEAK